MIDSGDTKVYVWLRIESRFSRLQKGDIFSPLELAPGVEAYGQNKNTLFIVESKLDENGATSIAARPIAKFEGVKL